MASAWISPRATASGRRHRVLFRLGGRESTPRYAGSFETLREARARREFVTLELASGRDPLVALRALAETPHARTFAEWAAAYQASRVDVAPATRTSIETHLGTILPAFGTRAPEAITPADVQEWIGGLTLKPSSARKYLMTLRAILDYAGLGENPARDSRVKLPRQEHVPVDPPSAADVETILANVPARWQLPLRVLAETGMRVGELHALEWGDVDEQASRFRVKQGKNAAARRWVAVPAALMAEVAATCPREDRVPSRRVFVGFTPAGAKGAMTRACKHGGIASFGPHSLRHRYASVQIGRGVPVTQVAAQLGHSRNSLTLDVYSHVLVDETELDYEAMLR